MTTVDATAGEEQQRGTLQLLVDRSYGPYFVGNLVAATGVWLYNIASAIVVYDLTGSSLVVGMVSVMTFSGPLLLAPYAGALSDRVNRRMLLIASRILSAASTGGLAAWIAIVGLRGSPGVVAVLLTSALLGISSGFSSPTQMTMVPALVPRADLSQAVALSSVTWNIARAIGPGLGAFIVASAGAAAAFGSAALGYLGFVVMLACLPGTLSPAPAASEPATVRAGLTYVHRDPPLRRLLLVTAGLGFAVDPVITLTPPLADVLGGRDVLVGALASGFGIGAVGSILVIAPLRVRFGIRRIAGAGAFGMGVGLALMGLAPTATTAVMAVVGAGVGYQIASTAVTGQLQLRVAETFRGRVMALWVVAFMGTRPIAAAVNGGVAEVVGPRLAVCASGLVAAVAGWLALQVPEGSAAESDFGAA